MADLSEKKKKKIVNDGGIRYERSYQLSHLVWMNDEEKIRWNI